MFCIENDITFIARDEFVREGEAGHKAAFLEPVDGAKRSGKENTLNLLTKPSNNHYISYIF